MWCPSTLRRTVGERMEPQPCHVPCTDARSVHARSRRTLRVRDRYMCGRCHSVRVAVGIHLGRRRARRVGHSRWRLKCVARCSGPSRSFVLASLRALHLDLSCAAGSSGGQAPPGSGAADASTGVVGSVTCLRRGAACVRPRSGQRSRKAACRHSPHGVEAADASGPNRSARIANPSDEMITQMHSSAKGARAAAS